MRKATWSNIGVDVKTAKNMDEVLRLSNLDYDVVTKPVWFTDEQTGRQILIPNKQATVRANDNHTYGVVSDSYNIVQNRDAFSFVDYMGNESDLEYERAGETYWGMVYIIAKLPNVNILGDAFTPHVIFRNSFQGGTKITAAICPLRIVCQNQFNFSFKNTDNTVAIKHTINAQSKLEEAKIVLKQSADYMADLNRMAEKFAGIKITEFELHRFLNIAFPLDGIEELSNCKRTRLETAKQTFKNAYLSEDNQNFKGTAWGLINAYTDLMTHQKAKGKEKTKEQTNFNRITFQKPMNNIIDMIRQAKTA